MKNLLILILDHGDLVDDIFHELSKNGFNATVLNARSIKHIIEDEEETDDIHFLNISHLNKNTFATTTTCYFIVDDVELNKLKDLIRTSTDNFKKIKGAMFSYPINDLEGTI